VRKDKSSFNYNVIIGGQPFMVRRQHHAYVAACMQVFVGPS
jgi:hypothetical protein